MYKKRSLVRDNRFKVSMNDDEIQAFEQSAEEQGQSNAEWGRNASMKQTEIHNRLKEKAKKRGMTAHQLNDFILNQFLGMDDTTTQNTLEGAENGQLQAT